MAVCRNQQTCIDFSEEDKVYNTSKVLVHAPKSQKGTYTFFLPCFVRIKIQNFLQVSHEQLDASINTKIMFDLNVTGLPPRLKDHIKDNIILRFHRNSIIHLESKNPEIVLKERELDGQQLIGYRIRRQISTAIIPDVFWTPFEMLYLIMTITIQHIEIKDEDILSQFQEFMSLKRIKNYKRPKTIQIRFNNMAYNGKLQRYQNNGIEYGDMINMMYTDDSSYGNYDLAQKLLSVQYTNKAKPIKVRELAKHINKQNNCYNCFKRCLKGLCQNSVGEGQEESQQVLKEEKLKKNFKYKNSKMNPFQHAHFEIPLYKIPFVSLVTIFLPLWIMGLISLGIFFQSSELAQRIASIATVMIAHIAFMPVIRGQLPPSPRIAFIQVLITFFCLVESIKNQDSEEAFDWKTNILFLISLGIQIFQAICLFLLIVMYECCWSPQYSMRPGTQLQLDTKQWNNEDCDSYFNSKIKSNKFKVFHFQEFENQVL